MKTTTRSSAPRLGVAIVLSGLTFFAGGSNARGAILSDELLVTSPTGAVAADILIPEGGAPSTESGAIFAPAAGLVGPLPPGGLAGLIPPGGVPGASFVILAEPPGEPIDPAELSPVFFPGPNGLVRVSDLIVSGIIPGTAPTPFIAFLSDNNPDLATVVALIPPAAPVPILLETGLLQDVSFSTAGAFPGFKVEVRSDVSVPEPSSIVILIGFAGLGAISSIWRRRRIA